MLPALHWHTVSPLLREILLDLMSVEIFSPFRLVGGTSLSLQIGHRMSLDIDLFTDADYGSLDFMLIDKYLRKSYPYVSDLSPGPIGMGLSYIIGHSFKDAIKLDLFYTDTYIYEPLYKENVCLASIEEVIAMKLDVVQRTGRKKDFWDLHALLEQFNIKDMLAFHKARYPFLHDEKLIVRNFTDFSQADDDFDPVCLLQKHWELIKYEIADAVEQSGLSV